MNGRRLPDGSPIADLEPGDYARRGSRWWVRLPLEDGRGLAQPLTENVWTVTEHDDGSITVTPSIRCTFTGWHGYLEHGVWRTA